MRWFGVGLPGDDFDQGIDKLRAEIAALQQNEDDDLTEAIFNLNKDLDWDDQYDDELDSGDYDLTEFEDEFMDFMAGTATVGTFAAAILASSLALF